MSNTATATPAAGAPAPAATSTPAAAPAGTPAPAAGTPAATPAATAAPAQAAEGAAKAAAETPTPATPPSAAPAAPVVPEKYELALPEGGPLDQSDVDAIAAMAKAKSWTNEQAQAALTEMGEGLTAQRARFRTELEAHTEIGGANLEASQQHARRALDRFLPATSPEGQALRLAMEKSGYGDYAPLVLVLARIGKAMGEDTPVATDKTRTGAAVDMVELFYGKQA